MSFDEKLMKVIVNKVYADDYNKQEIPLLFGCISSLYDYYRSVDDIALLVILDSAKKRIHEHLERDRIKPEELTALMISLLKDNELNELIENITERGKNEKNKLKQNDLRTTYLKLKKEKDNRA